MAEREPLDEDAAWAEIVAAYDEETADPDRDPPRTDPSGAPDRPDRDGDTLLKPWSADPDTPVNSITVFSAGAGPRDWQPEEPSDDDFDEDDEGHFVPPEPPPLPRGDSTTTLAWIAVLGGPLLLIGAILIQQPMTWWIVTLGVGGFLGGFGTLVARMKDGDDFEDPGRGAVV